MGESGGGTDPLDSTSCIHVGAVYGLTLLGFLKIYSPDTYFSAQVVHEAEYKQFYSVGFVWVVGIGMRRPTILLPLEW